jgi:hypothetical protein
MINFYLPLLVLISLNGRIYYEIKRRYKNVLFQRHSNKMNESPTNHKLISTRNNSHLPIPMTLCDSDRQLCSTTMNYTDNDSIIMAKRSPIKNEDNSTLRINIKEKKNRPNLSMQMTDSRRSSLQRAYSYVEKNHCTQVNRKIKFEYKNFFSFVLFRMN